MRKTLAIVLAGLFLVLFLIVVTVNHAVNTASDPEVIIGMVNDAEAYDYVYDNIVANLVHDMVEQGIAIDAGLTDTSSATDFTFDDPDAAYLAIIGLIEDLVPREYVKEKFEEGLRQTAPYLKGESDEFTIDLEVQERVRQIPVAVRALVADLELTGQVVDDLLIPRVAEFNSLVSSDALGIEFSDQEIEDLARLVFTKSWLEGQLFGAIDEITPYFAGDVESFDVVFRFDSRVVIIGEVLKEKLASEDTLYTLVFAQVIDPLIQQTVAQSTSVGFGVALSEKEVTEAFEVIAPPQWVREQGDGVIDALSNYLIGHADELRYSVELAERKRAATFELQVLARQKLRAVLNEIPACTTPQDALGATQDQSAGRLPRCLVGGAGTANLVLLAFGPTVDQQVASFIETQVPDRLSYSLADFESQVGSGLESVEEIRKRIAEGISFTDQDLIDAIADENDRESREDAERLMQVLAGGVLFTDKDITDNLTPSELKQFNDARDYAKRGMSLRWLLWILVLLPLVGISFVGSSTWPGRLKWAGGVAAVSGIIVFAIITIGWAAIDVANDRIPDYETDISAEFRADYPRLTAELESDEPVERLQRALDSWQRGWRNQTVPWIIVGVIAFAAGIILERSGPTTRTSRRSPNGPSNAPSTAPGAARTGGESPGDPRSSSVSTSTTG